jgi:hypothetical protein
MLRQLPFPIQLLLSQTTTSKLALYMSVSTIRNISLSWGITATPPSISVLTLSRMSKTALSTPHSKSALLCNNSRGPGELSYCAGLACLPQGEFRVSLTQELHGGISGRLTCPISILSTLIEECCIEGETNSGTHQSY